MPPHRGPNLAKPAFLVCTFTVLRYSIQLGAQQSNDRTTFVVPLRHSRAVGSPSDGDYEAVPRYATPGCDAYHGGEALTCCNAILSLHFVAPTWLALLKEGGNDKKQKY